MPINLRVNWPRVHNFDYVNIYTTVYSCIDGLRDHKLAKITGI